MSAGAPDRRRGREPGLRRAAAIASAVLALVSVAAGEPRSAPAGNGLRRGTITADGEDRYEYRRVSSDGLDVSAAPGNRGGNLREAVVDPSMPTSVDQESCVTWHGPTDRIVQPGVVLRAALDDDRVRLVMVSDNIVWGQRSAINVHLIDSDVWPDDHHQVAQFPTPHIGGPAHEQPLPWRFCARVVGARLWAKGWSTANPEPAWDDPTGTLVTTLPDGWAYPGRPGIYVGHVPPGLSTSYRAWHTAVLDGGTADPDEPGDEVDEPQGSGAGGEHGTGSGAGGAGAAGGPDGVDGSGAGTGIGTGEGGAGGGAGSEAGGSGQAVARRWAAVLHGVLGDLRGRTVASPADPAVTATAARLASEDPAAVADAVAGSAAGRNAERRYVTERLVGHGRADADAVDGATLDLVAALAGSAGFGSNDPASAWLVRLHERILRRAPTPTQLAGLTGELAAGAGRAAVARALWLSDEHAGQVADDLHQAIRCLPPTPAQRADAIARFRRYDGDVTRTAASLVAALVPTR